jgi:hypothetical protein
VGNAPEPLSSDDAGQRVVTPASARLALQAGGVMTGATGERMTVIQRAIGNAATGRLLRSPSGRDALLGLSHGEPNRRRVLARDAEAVREIGPRQRPPAMAFFEAYKRVSYDVWKRGENPSGWGPDAQQNGPWAFIGGSVGKMFGATDPSNPGAGPQLPQHTCAARLSWALNHSFAALAIHSGKLFYNDPKVTYAGKPGDGKNYIVGAPGMQEYLTSQWGAPDLKLSSLNTYSESVDPATGAKTSTRTSEGDASALRKRLGSAQIAVFAGAHHVGVISDQLNTDDYIYYDPDVVPAWAWILPAM